MALNQYRERDLSPPVYSEAFPEVDAVAGIIRGVKIVGTHSRDGMRYYPPEVLAKYVALYNGKACNIDHTKDGEKSRSMVDRFGWFENVKSKPDGLYADLRFNPEHPRAKEFVWWAKNNPRALGFSQDAFVRYSDLAKPNEPRRVEEILHVHSIDLVADPSLTEGITESTKYGAEKMDETTMPPVASTAEDMEMEPEAGGGLADLIGQLAAALMTDASIDSVKRSACLKLIEKLLDEVNGTAAPEVAPATEADGETDADAKMEKKEEESVNLKLLKAIETLTAKVEGLNIAPVQESANKPAPNKPVSAPRPEAKVPSKGTAFMQAPIEQLLGVTAQNGGW
jgi:hypothetical protein